MAHLAFAVAFMALPIVGFLLVRSLALSAAAYGAAVALSGGLVTFTIERGHLWTWTALEWLTLAAFVAATAALAIDRRRRGVVASVGLRAQFLAIGLPMLIVLLGVVLSRALAAPRSGWFTAVGFLVQRTHAEDNAKWLDFTAKLVQGQPIEQSVAMGGPLQVFLVPVIDAMSAISQLFLGGVNEVFVAANSVVYAEFLLAAMSALALAPLAERIFTVDGRPSRLPMLLVWAGILVITSGSLAVSGLGHLSFQFTMLVVAFWVAAFVVRASGRIRVLASLAIVPVFLVWFPLTPISLIVVLAGFVLGFGLLIRDRRAFSWTLALLWVVQAFLVIGALFGSLRFMTDTMEASAPEFARGGGGIVAAVGAVVPAVLPMLDLLSSQGGTEVAAALTAVLAVASALGAAIFISRHDPSGRTSVEWLRYAPGALVALYAIGLMVSGTWWAGSGPNYGALKSTFLATIVIAAVALPLALRALNPVSVRTTVVQVVAIGGVLYLLSVDGLLARAVTYASPQQWPSIQSEERGYWWPAEVKNTATQSIASLPIACAFRFDQTQPPTALPDGQNMYACTRMLAGLSGADWEALPLVNWSAREWFSNESGWEGEFENLSNMPEWVRQKDFILLDFNKNVIGLESVQSFLNRYKPSWAE